MPDHTILVRADIAAKCFLSEALYWRAFGRVPVEIYGEYGPWREEAGSFDDDKAPLPYGEELSEDECGYAGLIPDPRMQAILSDRPDSPIEHYEQMLGMIEKFDPPELDTLNKYREELSEAKRYHTEVADWMPLLEEYLDQFKAEICLDLRRGSLKAKGRKLPNPSVDISADLLVKNGAWFDSLEIETIPDAAWLTHDVNWEASSVIGKAASYIWLLIDVPELLGRYPPDQLLKPERVFPIGGSYAVSGFAAGAKISDSKRGRPPLPWDSFHVEVARLYASGQMPDKKEAAIATMQDWFVRNAGKAASRSAIGAKLKPYFDAIGRKS